MPYVFFCKVLEDEEACQEVARILLNHPGIVVKQVNFLKEKREGVKVMCEILEKERAEGVEEGVTIGVAQGVTIGVAQGVTIGEDYFAKLTERLLNDARIEELQRATKDKEFREILYREYGITR